LTLLLCAFPVAASAQNETVTVTGTTPKTRTEILQGFIRSYVAPSRDLGKIARWDDPICPVTIGLKDDLNAAVSEHIKTAAANVGARVSAKVPCRTNIVVIFSSDPQAVLDELQIHYQKYHGLMGDVDGPSHARTMAKVIAPIQAWYGTNVVDAAGRRFPINCGCNLISTGGGMNDGIKSIFISALVVVDVKKVAGQEIGAVGDYAAMLALSQTKAFDTCRALPSITNLLVADCDDNLKSAALTEADLGYLRGVYRIDTGYRLNQARADVLFEMEKSNAGK
jgi:hypothetical protein